MIENRLYGNSDYCERFVGSPHSVMYIKLQPRWSMKGMVVFKKLPEKLN